MPPLHKIVSENLESWREWRHRAGRLLFPASTRPRLGAVSLLHRFGSTLNHHVHLHACVTDGVFVPAAANAGCDAPLARPSRIAWVKLMARAEERCLLECPALQPPPASQMVMALGLWSRLA